MVNARPIGKLDSIAIFPALAIPVVTKSNYECPIEHLQTLENCIPHTDKLLLIGWRATEVPFLELLKTKLSTKVRGMAIAGNTTSAMNTITTVQRYVEGDFTPADGGFTDFVVKRQGEEFLKT
jgi:hypothetical protein